METTLAAQDEFWNWHLTIHSTRSARSQELLGTARITDLAVNVFLPWLWTRARQGRNDTLTRELQRRYFLWPASDDNAVLRLARQRLLGGRRFGASTAAFQQGLLQVVRDYCDHSNSICEECHFPRLVTEFAQRSRRTCLTDLPSPDI
jgi:hypothetical protein